MDSVGLNKPTKKPRPSWNLGTGRGQEEGLAPMTTRSISPAMQRKAEALAARAHTWARGRSKLDGAGFYVIPGSAPTVAHYANVFGCTCEGYRRRGVCAHNEACKILRRREDVAI